MTYLSDKARSKKRYTKYGVYALLLLVVVYFWPTLRTKLYPYAEPVIVSYSSSKLAFIHVPSSVKLYFSSRAALSAHATALELDVERLENALAEKDAILKDSHFIEISGSHVPSSTLVMYPSLRDVTTIYSTVLLSKGFKDGVEEKSLVYLRGRQPVCSIAEVHDTTSLCKLLSAPGVVTEGVTASSTSLLALTGIGGGSFVADVARETVVAVGDVIYLARDQGMVLGTVTDIIRDDQATSWHVYVRGSYNPVTSSVFYMDK